MAVRAAYLFNIHVILCARLKKLYAVLVGQLLSFLKRNHLEEQGAKNRVIETGIRKHSRAHTTYPLVIHIALVANKDFIDVHVRVLYHITWLRRGFVISVSAAIQEGDPPQQQYLLNLPHPIRDRVERPTIGHIVHQKNALGHASGGCDRA